MVGNRRAVNKAALCLLVVLFAAGAACAPSEEKRVQAMPINEVDLARVEDGTYRGSFTFSRFAYVADVKVQDHRIAAITMVKNRDDKWAVSAGTMADSVILYQKLGVDVIAGATTSCKVILKAIELSFSHRISD
jgi:uncharacterized protein with FMN-binding domain